MSGTRCSSVTVCPRRVSHSMKGAANIRIGFIGVGHIGGNLARLAAKAGHEVLVSNSRNPKTLFTLLGQFGDHTELRPGSRRKREHKVQRIPTYRAVRMTKCDPPVLAHQRCQRGRRSTHLICVARAAKRPRRNLHTVSRVCPSTRHVPFFKVLAGRVKRDAQLLRVAVDLG